MRTITKKEWRVCDYLIALGAFIFVSGIVFQFLDVYFELKWPVVLYLIIGVVLSGLVFLIAGVLCRLLWRRKYVSRV